MKIKRPTLSKPTPVRLHESTRPMLEATSAKFRLSPAQLIRIAVDEKLAEWQRTGSIEILSR
jgi:hypothetical protein